jgi:hypothetical protein
LPSFAKLPEIKNLSENRQASRNQGFIRESPSFPEIKDLAENLACATVRENFNTPTSQTVAEQRNQRNQNNQKHTNRNTR